MVVFSPNDDSTRSDIYLEPATIPAFPHDGQLWTLEQTRGFELLRLVYFALKLRKWKRAHESTGHPPQREYEFCCQLLYHAIFQQILALISLDAREQAFQLLDACSD